MHRRQILAGLAALSFAPAARAQPQLYYAPGGAAIGGFDPVSYFSDGAPRQGEPGIAVEWKGAIWNFSSRSNREAFEANPRAYAPQFGGYCAFAVAMGYLTGTDPTAWRIVDDDLYLVQAHRVAEIWEQDAHGYIRLARKNWPRILYE